MTLLYLLYEICVWLPIYLVCTLVCALITFVGCTCGDAHFWSYWPAHYWAKIGCWLALCPVEVKGRDKIDARTSYVFVANHTGAFDIFLLYGFLGHNFKWMLRKELRRMPVIGKVCDTAGQIWVDSHGNQGVMRTIRRAIATLKGGTSLVVFPEGTRTADGRLNPFKKGAFGLAAMMHLPVVPIAVTGPYEVMPKGTFIIRPHRLTLTILDPLPAVTREEGTEAGQERLRHDSEIAIAQCLADRSRSQCTHESSVG